jgi:hypothetical protein
MKKPKKDPRKNWLVVKAIRFDPIKLKACKRKKNIHRLADMCRQQLDILYSEVD